MSIVTLEFLMLNVDNVNLYLSSVSFQGVKLSTIVHMTFTNKLFYTCHA